MKLSLPPQEWRQNRNGKWRLQQPHITRFDKLQRMITNYKESERNQNASLRMCEDRCDSPLSHDSFKHFKTFVRPARTLAISATNNDFFAEPNELQRTTTSLAIFATNPDSLRFAEKKTWQCDLGFTYTYSTSPESLYAHGPRLVVLYSDLVAICFNRILQDDCPGM